MNLDIINLKEWESEFKPGYELTSNTARETAKVLTEKGIVEIIELKSGLQIVSNSYVGKITLDNLQVNIYPKLNGMQLYALLRYAYGLRELKLFDSATHAISEFSFFDLLIYELFIEAEDLIRRGILKNYIKNEGSLSSPRGRIDIVKLSKQGGVVADKLPCRYFNRSENTILNQTILAGLRLALGLVIDSGLKVNLEGISRMLSNTVDSIPLNRITLQKAKNSLNRLTERYTAILEIINILYESQGIQLEDGSISLNLRGYFFDMNAFFETLIGRLLVSSAAQYSVKDQFNLHDMFIYTPNFNPRGKRSPTPRPDFALMKHGKVIKLLDAKYRDLWDKNLPRDMLYQLAVYAVSGIGDKTATILYPSLNDTPSVQKIDINDPISSFKMASVILQPVNLKKVADHVMDSNFNELSKYITTLLI
ncbi:McrC family protein [Dehalobacter sp. TBBPA1]|uniref:McrC family protein n=1 Tax=Dehalobacter sp. TBBPA1 TaxID=3235037 RepID=UPI0034A2CC40